jgi:hypothetical protein
MIGEVANIERSLCRRHGFSHVVQAWKQKFFKPLLLPILLDREQWLFVFGNRLQLTRCNPPKESLALTAMQACFLWLAPRPGAMFGGTAMRAFVVFAGGGAR